MKALRLILSTIISLTFLALFLEGFHSSLPAAILAGGLSFLGGMLMFSPDRKTKETKKTQLKPPKNRKKVIPAPGDDEFVCEGVTRGELKRIVREGKEQVNRIEETGLKIMNHTVRVDVLEICSIANDIFDNFLKDPRDIKESRRFLLYYLDTTERIVSKYYELSNTSYLSDEAKKTLKDVESTLVLIKDSFRNHLKKLTENDVLDLEAEIRVLQNTIKREGI
ncbi:5-bromo-4-chloroindolyl phosphate hydrolysis family protein [Thermoclostridium stercorarium]|jgi:5-bromo-4-chloroindolyl phosphate hydrolysis protein|uniref:5-bromo-4-chloroindolyl phosphate hydrolysis protein n=1 Tax=Thermoclostridium stercorarium subsp. leptospartum DSM 9219 TaxID=1346611 RepID=A0A1B1YIH7_THEST|nr:5-bromo-4-chloroindolyl phosphate hydrolysis family protein [Thermoclostridium stercorarium]ANX00575.1 5-bromo-4-chloroindolyl phosphate hydrolysis protein [Thermoclostridium stercorarium subsp. leptospartum DSM 9219]UZQ86186.1 5-bromo-4-chloroindolyl phosphate hydrolysis family protein [Thermoclostridium stercorarium]